MIVLPKWTFWVTCFGTLLLQKSIAGSFHHILPQFTTRKRVCIDCSSPLKRLSNRDKVNVCKILHSLRHLFWQVLNDLQAALISFVIIAYSCLASCWLIRKDIAQNHPNGEIVWLQHCSKVGILQITLLSYRQHHILCRHNRERNEINHNTAVLYVLQYCSI